MLLVKGLTYVKDLAGNVKSLACLRRAAGNF